MTWPRLTNLIQTDHVNIYSATIGRDKGGGFDPSYAKNPTFLNVPCSVQFQSIEETVDEQQRVLQVNLYVIMFEVNPSVKARDKITWVDSGNVARTAFVRSSAEVTGNGATWEVPIVEKI